MTSVSLQLGPCLAVDVSCACCELCVFKLCVFTLCV